MEPSARMRDGARASVSRSSAVSPTTSRSAGASIRRLRASSSAVAVTEVERNAAPAEAVWPVVKSRCTVASTSGIRTASSVPVGTTNRMCCSAIRRFARVSRALMAVWPTSITAAISAVWTPHTKRRASASRVSGSSAGVQTAKSSARRSSPPGWATGARSSAASSGSRACSRASRRTVSIAMRLATVVNQAAGLMSISRSRLAAARAKASWTASSARSRSPVNRATAATSRGHSRRNVSSRSGVATGSA